MPTFLTLDEFKPQALLGLVENREVPFTPILRSFLPLEESFSTNFMYDIIDQTRVTAASLSEFGAPAPFRDKKQVARALGEVAKIQHRIRFSEKDQLEYMNGRNDREKQALLDRALTNVADLRIGVEHTEELLRAAAVYEGKLVYDHDGVKLDIDFGIPLANKLNVTGADKWDQADTANPLEDLIEASLVFKDKNAGQMPLEIHMPFAQLREIMKAKSTISAIKGVAGGNVLPRDIDEYLQANMLPAIKVNDQVVTLPDGVTTKRYLPERRIVLLGTAMDPQLGYTALGPTVERQGQPGIFVNPWEKLETKDEIVEVGEAAFPALQRPNAVFHMNV